MKYNLPKLKEDFEREGFVLLENFIPTERAIAARDWLLKQDSQKLCKSWGDQEPGVPLAVYQNIHYLENPLAEILKEDEFFEVSSYLMGEKTYIWSSKVNLKAAWCGTVEYYHQDYVYWKDRGYPRADMLTAMVCLDEQNVENAALHIVPRSHRNGFLQHQQFFNVNGLSKFMVPPGLMTELYKENGMYVVNAKPGDAVFFHCNLVHGSAHNISGHNRMILLAQMNTETNKPITVNESAKSFNLKRAELEMNEALRRYNLFKEKYDAEKNSSDLVFNSHVPNEEKEMR